MQDRYVADIGDFGKFHLFRYLFNHRESPLTGKALSQIWFMHQGEGEQNNDGRHIDYFDRMRGTDEYLENALKGILLRDKREVFELEKVNLLNNAEFYYDEVPKVLDQRHFWLDKALRFANNSQVVAVAPDNGMALKCNRAERTFEHLTLKEHYKHKSSPHKYIFSDEVNRLYHLPQLEVCVIYQHLSRCFSHDQQIESLLFSLRNDYQHVIAIKHKPYSPRAFFFLCKNDSIFESLQVRLEAFEKSFSQFWKLFR